MEKKILVTGCAGFIGFHLASFLKKRGNYVVGVDNFNSYYSPTLKRRRAALLQDLGITIHEAEIAQPDFFKDFFAKEKITHIAHLAAQAGVRFSKERPDLYLKSNVEAFLYLLEALRFQPHIRLVYASSSSVYGCSEKIPFSFSDKTDSPANFYAVTKKTNELMAYSYSHLYGLNMTGLRFFTVYGPWGRPDMAYFSFASAIEKTQPITLYSEGKMQRDFTYIDDIVSGTAALLDMEKASKPVYNLGNNKPQHVLHLVSLLEERLGKKATLILEKDAKGEIPITYADISDASHDFAFFPQTSLSEGLTHFVSWFQKENASSYIIG